ncbi:MAG TPA: nucleotidyltransferase domain-containing protein [Anaerolineales bacterium]|nr:nucleotidyltransferase domain-containing protein [Anaerolineales bacterium]
MVREILNQKNTIATLCRNMGVERLFVFGSATHGSTLADVRDLDFLVQFKPMPPVQHAHNYFRLAEQLEELFQAPIDLVEIEAIDNPYFKEAVDESKVSVYELS